MTFIIGQSFEGIYPPEAAAWCNENNAHMETCEGGYIVMENLPAPEPTAKEQVSELEAKYNLPRPVRTALLLAREAGQSVDTELMSRVDEIEAVAVQLREVAEESASGIGNV